MRYIPNYELKVLTNSEFKEQIATIEATLSEYKNEGYFKSFDGTNIHYEYFLCENSKASVVIVHGLSEFTKKYYESTMYFLNQGYNVFLYDQRCHGLSDRLTKRIDMIHVKSFKHYAKDLDLYIDNIVLKADKKPIYLYSHSMGGAVTATYLTQHENKVEKAVLSAPLFQPEIGNVPLPIAKGGIKMLSILVGPKRKYSGSKEFNPNFEFEKSDDESYSRFEHNMSMRVNNENYQTTPMSLDWVNSALGHSLYIRRKRVVDRIKTPVLLITAENDTVVRIQPHYDFAKMCPLCEHVVQKGAKHAMLTSTDEIIAQHVDCVMKFFAR